jgi:hypothetical protein
MDECRLHHQHHASKFSIPPVILISLLQLSQHRSSAAGRFCGDNHGAIEITTAQIEKLSKSVGYPTVTNVP